MYYNPYEQGLPKHNWYKANFHTHTSIDNCGTVEPETVIRAYETAGYDVLTISSHRTVTDVSELAKKTAMTLVTGYEHNSPEHMLCIGVERLLKGMTYQDMVDDCAEQGGFSILAHPNWDGSQFDFELRHWAMSRIDTFSGFTGLEVSNLGLERWGGGSYLALDVWDHVLSNRQITWGFGNDDMHYWEDFANSWNVVLAPDKSVESILDAVKRGAFYVSSGVQLREYTFDGKTLCVTAAIKDSHPGTYEYKFVGENGEVLSKQVAESAQYALVGDESYVRVEVRSECGAFLFTQPLLNTEQYSVSHAGA